MTDSYYIVLRLLFVVVGLLNEGLIEAQELEAFSEDGKLWLERILSLGR